MDINDLIATFLLGAEGAMLAAAFVVGALPVIAAVAAPVVAVVAAVFWAWKKLSR